jgi:CheY-like chemotaxis protein
MVKTVLETEGYDVSVADDGFAALRAVDALVPDCVVLDVMMPGMDGWRVLRAMKADRRLARIPVIVCSIVDNRPLGYSLGASDYIVKPIDPATLTDTLDRVSVRGEGADGYVLVVDDEHGVRELMTAALRHAGFNARSAPSGETALKLASSQPPLAVFCDLMMPNGMSGFEFVARFRSDPQTAGIPVVIVTGKDITPDDRKFISGEMAEVIRKGELLLSDVTSRLRDTLEDLGVRPSNGEDSVR